MDLPKHYREVEVVMGDGECTMESSYRPKFVLPQGREEAEKLRNKLQKFWSILGTSLSGR